MASIEEAVIKRVLPHSIEAEQSVIGSMMIDREAIVVASELISGDDFYNKQYGVVFESMVELHEEGRPVDLVTLQDRLKEKDVPGEASSLNTAHGYISQHNKNFQKPQCPTRDISRTLTFLGMPEGQNR